MDIKLTNFSFFNFQNIVSLKYSHNFSLKDKKIMAIAGIIFLLLAAIFCHAINRYRLWSLSGKQIIDNNKQTESTSSHDQSLVNVIEHPNLVKSDKDIIEDQNQLVQEKIKKDSSDPKEMNSLDNIEDLIKEDLPIKSLIESTTGLISPLADIVLHYVGHDPKKIVRDFLDSINVQNDVLGRSNVVLGRSYDVLITLTTIDSPEPQLIKYSCFDNIFSPKVLVGTNIDKATPEDYSFLYTPFFLRYTNTPQPYVQIDINQIQSIELAFNIGKYIQYKDRCKLNDLSIIIDDKGFINIPSEKFTSKKSISGNIYLIEISKKDGCKVAEIDMRIKEDRQYVYVSYY